MYLALLIHPDSNQRRKLHELLTQGGDVECIELESESKANAWCDANDRKVHFIIDGWHLASPPEGFVKKLRTKKNGAEALHLRISSPEDFGWLASLLHTPGLLNAIFTTSSRLTGFTRNVKQKLAADPLVKHHALVVDDDDEARAIVKQYLLTFGFSHVTEAANGAMALSHVSTNYAALSLIVADWHMPQMTGIELLRQLKLKPWTARIPFVMVTAQTPAEPVKALHAAASGVDGYLLKPFNSKTFASQMEGILHEIQKHRQVEAYLIAGRVLLAQDDWMRAEEALHEGLTLFPSNALLLEALGDLSTAHARESKKLAPAADHYERALRINPFNVSVAMKYFEVTSAMGRINDAVKILKGHLRRSELEDSLRIQLGKIFLQNGEIEAAREEFQRAATSNPLNDEAKALLTSLETTEPQKPKRRKAA